MLASVHMVGKGRGKIGAGCELIFCFLSINQLTRGSQFDSLTQTATGFNVAEAEAYAKYAGNSELPPLPPRALPMQALDHAAGYLLAFGINAALCKTITVSF